MTNPGRATSPAFMMRNLGFSLGAAFSSYAGMGWGPMLGIGSMASAGSVYSSGKICANDSEVEKSEWIVSLLKDLMRNPSDATNQNDADAVLKNYLDSIREKIKEQEKTDSLGYVGQCIGGAGASLAYILLLADNSFFKENLPEVTLLTSMLAGASLGYGITYAAGLYCLFSRKISGPTKAQPNEEKLDSPGAEAQTENRNGEEPTLKHKAQ